ncbi:MAG: hypothetical protein EA381_00035 [Planctomycetaceae bacterium]|nr:MAG: hypothetical protein EA381_00035 [Planctomycetaceae bacterium]
MTNHLQEFKPAQQTRPGTGLKWESSIDLLPTDSPHFGDTGTACDLLTPSDCLHSADVLAADDILNSSAGVEVKPGKSRSHAKVSARSPFPCNACGRELSSPDGYLLTTKEVVGSQRFWQHYFHQRYDDLGSRLIYNYRDFSRDKSIREFYVDPLAAQKKPWLFCGECVRMFSIDRKRAQFHAKLWWESDQTFSPPGNGAAPAAAINLRGPWYRRRGPATWGLLTIACVATVVMAFLSTPIRNQFIQVPPLSLTAATRAGPTTLTDAPIPPPDVAELATAEPAPSDRGLVPKVVDPPAAETAPPDGAHLYDPSMVAPSDEPMRVDRVDPESAAEASSGPAIESEAEPVPAENAEQFGEQPAVQPTATPDATGEKDTPPAHEANTAIAQELRTWNDRPGRTIRGRLIRVSEGRVTVEQVDGKTAEIDLDLLSDADQDYVSTQTVNSILRPMTLTVSLTFTMTPTMSMALKPTETPRDHETSDTALSPDR